MLLDRFTKVLLLAIVVLLAVIVMKPVFEPENSYAAKKIEYKVVYGLPSVADMRGEPFFKGTENGLNKYGAEGWELVEYSNSGWAILIRR